ncbi:MAG: hypothetical protein JW955_09970 [Sedimentisphaerales bacterium]|nr:hypothetical protein [Sedimentisphaerales bacterium]
MQGFSARGVVAINGLTGIERQVFRLLVGGQTVTGIAARSRMSGKTVDAGRRGVTHRLRAPAVAGLVRWALREG